MELSISTWSFPHLELGEASTVAAALGFKAIDIGYFGAPALDKKRLLTEPRRYGVELAEMLPLRFSNLFHLFGSDVSDRNLARPVNRQNHDDLKSVLEFARAASVPSVMVLPGVVNAGQSRSGAIDQAVESLKPIVAAGLESNIEILIEPHVGSILNSPAQTLELVERVQGLKIVLDPSHFISMGYRQAEIEPLAKVAGHVHIRQARSGTIQTEMAAGIIDFAGFFGELRNSNYDRWLTIEYEYEPGTNSSIVDVLSETAKLRDCFRIWADQR